MNVRTTKQPKCNKKQISNTSAPPLFKILRDVLVGVLKFLLMRPIIWRFCVVHLSELVERLDFAIKGVVQFITDLF